MDKSSGSSLPGAEDLVNLPRYQFRKLERGEKMRILKVNPASRREETIVCELRHVPTGGKLESQEPKSPAIFTYDPFSYEALSYRWGVGDFNQSIRIHENDRFYHFQIHKHLFEALLELRQAAEVRYLWIDTICINQEDFAERSKQVARMNEVYGEADHVCIWLGTEEDGSTDALTELLKGRKRGLDVYDFDNNCLDENFIRWWASFVALLKRQWFSRRWVVQEVSLARKATIYCGSASVDWEDFAAAVSLLNDVDVAAKKLSEQSRKLAVVAGLRYTPDLFEEVGVLTATKLVNTASRLFRKAPGGQHQRVSTLEDIVARLAMFQTSEPKDYIYALLALAKDSQPYAGIPDYLDGQPLSAEQQRALYAVVRLFPSPYRQRYTVDYGQDDVEVYQQFIHFAISKSDPALALDIICRPFAPGPDKVKNLPSWIPNISDLSHAPQAHLKKTSFRMERQRGDPFVSMPDTNTHYSAAGRKPLEKAKLRYRKRKRSYSMFVRGFILDTVKIIESASQVGNIPKGWIALGRQQKDDEALWRTLVADRGPKGIVPGIYKNIIESALRDIEAGFDIRKHMEDHQSSITTDAWPQVEATIWGRCLFETSRRHLGLGPQRMEEASKSKSRLVVAILHGCSVPIILEESTKTDEVMAAELWEDEEDRETRLANAMENSVIKKMVGRLHEKRAAKALKQTEDGVNVNGGPYGPIQGSDETTSVTKADTQTVGSDESRMLHAKNDPTEHAAMDELELLSSNWIATVLQPHTGGAMTLMLFAALMAFGFRQTLAAGELMLFVGPHFLDKLSELRRRRLPRIQALLLPHNFDLVVLAALAFLAVSWVVYSPLYALYCGATVAFADALFMGLLPPNIATTYKSLLLGVTKLSLADISKHFLSVARREKQTLPHQKPSPMPEQAKQDLANNSQVQGEKTEPSRVANSAMPNNRANKTKPEEPHQVPRYYYKVIGECFVHNMMNGEAIKWQNDTTVTGRPEDRVLTQEFELR